MKFLDKLLKWLRREDNHVRAGRQRSDEAVGAPSQGTGAYGGRSGVSGQKVGANTEVAQSQVRDRWIWLMIADIVPELMAGNNDQEKSQMLLAEMVRRANVPWPQIFFAIGTVEQESNRRIH